jgi:outer membrane immunogenic protein
MKKLLLSTAAIGLMSTAALAADLPVYEPAPMVAPVPMASDWSGVYIGLHGGYGWADLSDDDTGIDFDDAEMEGPVFGGQIGVNMQWNYFVLGAEGDASWSGINEEGEFDLDTDEEEIGFDWLASARLRGGLAFDRFMVYATGGVGFTEFDSDGVNDDDDEVQVGWVAGGGAEFLLTNNVTAGVEYLHYEFDETFEDGDESIDSSVDVIRGRVNVKFNSLFGG